MARQLTNEIGLSVTTEISPGVVGTVFDLLQPNTIGAYGALITTKARRPISPTRGRKKGATVDLDSTVEFEADLTMDQFNLFIEGFLFAEFTNVEFELRAGSGLTPPPALGTGYTIDGASALLGTKMVQGAGFGTLVYAKGYLTAANNGMKIITADVTTSDVLVTVSGNVIETPPTNATVTVAGLRTDDLTMVIAADGTGTITTAGDIDWTDMGLKNGVELHCGGVDADLIVANPFIVNATNVYGYIRVESFTATVITFSKATLTMLLGGAGTSTLGTVDILIGRMGRNVPVSADADDERYLIRSYQFELAWTTLGTGSVPEYEYSIANFASEMALDIPSTDLAKISYTFVGKDTDDIVEAGDRKAGAVDARLPLRETAFGTSSDLVSITTDLISAVSDVCVKSMTFTILNNMSPEKCLGTLGAVFVNAGLFEFNIEAQMAFTTKEITNAIKNNTTVTFQTILRNEDGAICFDIPELTFGGGGRDFPVDQTVLVNITGESFTSNTFGYDVGVTVFPVVPLAA